MEVQKYVMWLKYWNIHLILERFNFPIGSASERETATGHSTEARRLTNSWAYMMMLTNVLASVSYSARWWEFDMGLADEVYSVWYHNDFINQCGMTRANILELDSAVRGIARACHWDDAGALGQVATKRVVLGSTRHWTCGVLKMQDQVAPLWYSGQINGNELDETTRKNNEQ